MATNWKSGNQNTIAMGLSYNGAEVAVIGAAYSQPSRGLYVGTTGNVAVTLYPTGDAVTFSGVPAGTLLPIFSSIMTGFSGTIGSVLSLY